MNEPVATHREEINADDLNSLLPHNFPTEKVSDLILAFSVVTLLCHILILFPALKVIDFYFQLIMEKYSSIECRVEAFPSKLLKSFILETRTDDLLSLQVCMVLVSCSVANDHC